MKWRIFISAILFAPVISEAQAPQFAVVRPDGTTYICPTWDSAYNKAVNGDNIYLPGVIIPGYMYIDKNINIYGAGHHPDSCTITGKTTIDHVVLKSNASGGSIEGLNIVGNFYLNYTNRRINNYTVKRCRFSALQDGVNLQNIDSFYTNIYITECVFNTADLVKCTNFTISKNLILNYIASPKNCLIKNNSFLSAANPFYNAISNCNVENNIFLYDLSLSSTVYCSNNFYNNLKVGINPIFISCQNQGVEVSTQTVNNINEIFISYNTFGTGFPYLDNYHLKPTCPGINAGTDGTDVGIYGTSSPTSQGWVPSNPHIYFKQVAQQTNNSGQLQIQFKVRTNN